MLIFNIEEVDLVRLFGNEPLFVISCAIPLSFRFVADMERIEASIQILHLIIYIFEVFHKILIINSIVFYCVKDLLDVSVKRAKGTNRGLYVQTILNILDVLIKPDYIRHY